jgi:hypothetical protein
VPVSLTRAHAAPGHHRPVATKKLAKSFLVSRGEQKIFGRRRPSGAALVIGFINKIPNLRSKAGYRARSRLLGRSQAGLTCISQRRTRVASAVFKPKNHLKIGPIEASGAAAGASVSPCVMARSSHCSTARVTVRAVGPNAQHVRHATNFGSRSLLIQRFEPPQKGQGRDGCKEPDTRSGPLSPDLWVMFVDPPALDS